jgi:hypothetical protein
MNAIKHAPLTKRTRCLNQELSAAMSPPIAERIFDAFIATKPTKDEIDLASVYLAWTIFELTPEEKINAILG